MGEKRILYGEYVGSSNIISIFARTITNSTYFYVLQGVLINTIKF